MLGPPGSNAKCGGESVGWFYRIERGGDVAQDGGLAGRALQRLIGERDELFGMECGGEALQPHGRHFPIAIASRTAQQIELAARGFDKCGP